MTVHHLVQDKLKIVDVEYDGKFSAYPVDVSSYLALDDFRLDTRGVPRSEITDTYQPDRITFYALAHWNQYIVSGEERDWKTFLAQAIWLVEHASDIGETGGTKTELQLSGWPVSYPQAEHLATSCWLSAFVQGSAISVLVRAYQLTEEKIFLEVARRAFNTFEQDILDGGIQTPIGEHGIFFEEAAVYPASHALNGMLFALIGLYDFLALTKEGRIEQLIERSLQTLHALLEEYDTGYWTYTDLLHRRLATRSQHTLNTTLLSLIGQYARCEICLTYAARWKRYTQQWGSRLRYQLNCRLSALSNRFWKGIQVRLFPRIQTSQNPKPNTPNTDFPGTGGVITVLKGLAQLMQDRWSVEYIAQYVRPNPDKLIIHKFGTRIMTPWHFPFAWLYLLTGARKIVSLMRHGAGFQVIMPQDGVFSGALAGLAGKLTGVRVVCIDHGDLSLFTPRNLAVLRAERLRIIQSRPWPGFLKLLVRFMLIFYWPSRYLMARIAARFIDHFLIPGVAGDSIEEGCQIIGIHPGRITRYGSMVDIKNHAVPDASLKKQIRKQKGLAADAIVVAIVCRLAPEKGVDIALESIHRALAMLSVEQKRRVRVVIAGDGPIRGQVEEQISQLQLDETCLLWGELSAEEVAMLLGISDIFLYTSTRGACYAMAVLEAMASACAVIASTEPLSNELLLADGRGFAVPSGDVESTSIALAQLLNDTRECERMGKLAREYIATFHNPAMFRRTLLRATYWSDLEQLLVTDKRN